MEIDVKTFWYGSWLALYDDFDGPLKNNEGTGGDVVKMC